ncbi:MAG TPA: hypothetical protein VK690_05700, partial [Stellaceae bacterium]|nr:hypothetical protein [Stellaceae bacterium]
MNPAPRPLSDGERLDWLRLIRSENVGPVGLMQERQQAGLSGILQIVSGRLCPYSYSSPMESPFGACRLTLLSKGGGPNGGIGRRIP